MGGSWCAFHGDCICKNRENSMNDMNCPLHRPDWEEYWSKIYKQWQREWDDYHGFKYKRPPWL